MPSSPPSLVTTNSMYWHREALAIEAQVLCSRSDRADLELTAIGRCVTLALASDAPLPAPVRTFDDDVSAAQTAGVLGLVRACGALITSCSRPSCRGASSRGTSTCPDRACR